MYAHLFIKWYGRQPTKFQEAVICLLERQRWRQGFVRACIDTSRVSLFELEPILLQYIRFLRDTYTPHGHIMVVDRTKSAAAFRVAEAFNSKDTSVHALSGAGRHSSRRGIAATQAIAFRMNTYAPSAKGDIHARDTISNLLSTVPLSRGSAVIFIGRYHPCSLRAFSQYYRVMHARSSLPDSTVLPLRASQAINQRELLKLKWLNKLRSSRAARSAPTALAERNSLRPPAAIHCGQRPQLTALAERNKLCRCQAAA